MVQITRLLVDGQRPSLGTLVLDDGSAQEVDSDFVVGRQPEEDPLVQAGTAKPFRLADPSRLVSGRHAVLKLVGWEVYVEDLGSRNGTFAVAPDGRETPVGAKPVLIESGASVRVGNRRLTYHSHHRVK
jgi:pSer/pThr/pTyr-binding forkhead associated (FHA) protein